MFSEVNGSLLPICQSAPSRTEGSFVFVFFLFQCLFEIKKQKPHAQESGRDPEAAREAAESSVLQRARACSVSCWFLDKQRWMAIGAGGFRRRWVQGRGEESRASRFQGSPAGCGCGERLGGHRRVVLGRRWPHGTGGGEWFPGIWKTQGGETGAEPAAEGAPHGAAGRVTEGSGWHSVGSPTL